MCKVLGEEWGKILGEELTKPYMINLYNFIESRREMTTVYPPKEDVFNAYKFTPYSKVKVCIVGMDPYIRNN